jgi:arylsulfatase
LVGEEIQGTILATEFIETFKEYPPSQAPASFTIAPPDAILKMLRRQQAAAQTKD